MARRETVVLTNMCMIYDGQGNILVQDRQDPDWPGVTFPGGHVELGESFVESVIREVREETGLTIRKPRLCGLKHFLRDDGVRYVVFFFKTDCFSGELTSSDEGEVFWIKRSELGDYRLAYDFENMLRVFESEDLSEFYYEKVNGEWQLTLL
ncbi:MAG: 8-oxo-dGTP diphosphatase [Oscillibacter sp.]|nr:8-oxo-dGTP diphosphatase [Oscillibacter sp.]